METSIQLTRKDVSDQLYVGTYGGEYDDNYGSYARYALQIDDLSIHGFSPEEFKKLAILMINHLIANGHSFELIPNPNQDIHQELLAKN